MLKPKNRERLQDCYVDSMVDSLLSDDHALRDFVDSWAETLSNEELLDFYREIHGR